MCEQRVDLEDTMAKLRKIITDMTQTMKEQFKTQFALINKNFAEVFKELFGGGNASLKLEDENNILECGIDIRVQPPGKKLQNTQFLEITHRKGTMEAADTVYGVTMEENGISKLLSMKLKNS